MARLDRTGHSQLRRRRAMATQGTHIPTFSRCQYGRHPSVEISSRPSGPLSCNYKPWSRTRNFEGAIVARRTAAIQFNSKLHCLQQWPMQNRASALGTFQDIGLPGFLCVTRYASPRATLCNITISLSWDPFIGQRPHRLLLTARQDLTRAATKPGLVRVQQIFCMKGFSHCGV